SARAGGDVEVGGRVSGVVQALEIEPAPVVRDPRRVLLRRRIDLGHARRRAPWIAPRRALDDPYVVARAATRAPKKSSSPSARIAGCDASNVASDGIAVGCVNPASVRVATNSLYELPSRVDWK